MTTTSLAARQIVPHPTSGTNEHSTKSPAAASVQDDDRCACGYTGPEHRQNCDADCPGTGEPHAWVRGHGRYPNYYCADCPAWFEPDYDHEGA